MLEFLSPHSDTDAINLLKADHDTVKELFEQFENAEDRREKKKICAKTLMELKIHATIEEEIFYPAVRAEMEDEDGIMFEADEEHHVAKVLVAELDAMSGSEDHFDAKYTVLAENIKHHIKEEEGQMFPKARELDLDYDAIGQKLLKRKEDLKKKGVPVSAEEKMIKATGNANSPAAMAKKKSGKSVKIHHPRVVMKKSKAKPAAKPKRRKAA